jgi:hypothetical protein
MSSGTTSTYSLYCGLWRVDSEFVSKIHIKNALIVGPLTVLPVLYMADGAQYSLQPIQVPTAGTAQDFVVTLYYGDGSGQYVMPVHLAAQASTTIDIGMFIAMAQPDANGNLIPVTQDLDYHRRTNAPCCGHGRPL